MHERRIDKLSDLLLTLINIVLLGAGNSIYHAERLRYGKTLFKKSDFDFYEKIDDLHKVTDPLKLIFYPLIVIFSYLLIKQNVWMFLLSIVLNIPPLNTITVIVANIIVIPLAIIVAKIRRIKI